MQQSKTENLNLPTQVMTSPAGQSLSLVLQKSSEGIERLGVTTYEGLLSFKQLAAHFQIEKNSDAMKEVHKMQRDVDASRINGLKKYWVNSAGMVFPSMTIFANSLSVENTISVGDRVIVVATLPSDADRFIGDGQGRTTFIKWLVEQLESDHAALSYTINCKLIVTHTPTLADASKIIKQCFADYHCRLVKPNKSVSKHFDSATPFARFVNDLLELPADDGRIIKERIALHGKLKTGHLWTFDQFTALIQRFLKVTPASANQQLKEQADYDASLSLCADFLAQVFKVLPVGMLDAGNHVHESVMFSKAVFCNALGYVGRSLLDEMLVDGDGHAGWNKLSGLSIPLAAKNDKYWQANKVTMLDEGSVKIMKGTDKRIATLICRELRIYPCQELSA